jgi:excisionase family DNA binding protein
MIDRDPLQDPRALLNIFYPGSFPDPLRLPEEEPVPTRAPSTPPESYDLAMAAEFLGMSKRKLREMVKARRIVCTRIDYRNYLFTQADLNEFLATYRTKPKRI